MVWQSRGLANRTDRIWCLSPFTVNPSECGKARSEIEQLTGQAFSGRKLPQSYLLHVNYVCSSIHEILATSVVLILTDPKFNISRASNARNPGPRGALF